MTKRTVTITAKDVARMRQAEANEIPGAHVPTAFMDEARATLKSMGIVGIPTAITIAEDWPEPLYQITYEDGHE